MPAWGLINDSPLIYYGRRLLRLKRAVRQPSATRFGFSYKFQKLVLNRVEMDRLQYSRNGLVGLHLRKIALEVSGRAKLQAGFKTGKLKLSIGVYGHRRIQTIGQEIRVGSNLNYAYYHHEGTRPHIITPRESGGTLVFRKGSKVIKTEMVRHPGTRANKYLSSQLRPVILR